MSTPNSITVSLELAKKLRDAGWPQDESTFWWVRDERTNEWQCIYDGHCLKAMTNDAGYTRLDEPLTYYISDIEGGNECTNDEEIAEKYAAPTEEEVLRSLPHPLAIVVTRTEAAVFCNEEGYDLQWNCGPEALHDYIDDTFPYSAATDTVANAAAALYCFLSEHKLLPPQ